MKSLNEFSELELMIGNLFGEARSIEGDVSDDIREYLAIGGCVMNRVNSKRFPNTIKEVILAHKQFSWTNAGDPSRDKVISFLETKQPHTMYNRLKIFAEAVIERRSVDFSYGADHYVARWLYEKTDKQRWITEMQITGVWGGHVFLKANYK